MEEVEEYVVAISGFETEKRLCVRGMHGTSHGASSLGEVVRVILLCEMGDLRGAKVRVAVAQVSPGNAGGNVGGSKGAQTGSSFQNSHYRVVL
jgi:hypothetical protein